ncbi:Regulatory protein LuxO [Thalassocella blandensis]|nr:Regulatory protein LuxO [Thalassocella blandensis]
MEDKQTANANILFVDDEPGILNSLKRITRKLPAHCYFANSGREALDLLAETPCDVIVSDMMMPEMDGATLLAEIAHLYPESVRLVLSGYSDDDLVMTAINEGKIWGYIRKPWEDHQLIVTLKQALASQQLLIERALLRRRLASFKQNYQSGFCSFIGHSRIMQRVYEQIDLAGRSSAAVFITGASGTGKELVAEALHQCSPRKDGPFIALNCAAIPSELMESEIFGHIKGAFSGAVAQRDGAATLADGGTLFLDELGEMDISLQAKLLRFIQTGKFQKVGSSKQESVDIRFVSATNRNPLAAIKEGLLREDLYYRLNVVAITLPPLAKRDNDPYELACEFLKRFSKKESKDFTGYTEDAKKLLLAYEWPGNIRQLENCIHNVVIMSKGPLVEADELALPLHLTESDIENYITQAKEIAIPEETSSEALNNPTENVATAPNSGEPLLRPLATVEREHIEQVLSVCEDNVVKAASILEISPSTLYRKIQGWEKSAE